MLNLSHYGNLSYCLPFSTLCTCFAIYVPKELKEQYGLCSEIKLFIMSGIIKAIVHMHFNRFVSVDNIFFFKIILKQNH